MQIIPDIRVLEFDIQSSMSYWYVAQRFYGEKYIFSTSFARELHFLSKPESAPLQD